MGEDSLHLTLHQQAEVKGKTIHLRDIAEISPQGEKADRLGNFEIALAPQPGQSKELLSKSVLKRLNTRATEPLQVDEPIPSKIKVTRQGTIITADRLKDMLASFLKDHMTELPSAQIRISSFKPPENFTLPLGKVECEIIPSNGDIIQSSSFSFLFSIDGSVVKNLSVPTILEAVGEVATAASTIRRGEIIRPEHITMSLHDLSRIRSPLPSPDALVGMRAKKTISRGRVLEARWLESPPLINKGGVVKIIASKGTLFLSTLGIALTDGKMGEMIRVENINSNKLLFCRVTSRDTVNVEF